MYVCLQQDYRRLLWIPFGIVDYYYANLIYFIEYLPRSLT